MRGRLDGRSEDMALVYLSNGLMFIEDDRTLRSRTEFLSFYLAMPKRVGIWECKGLCLMDTINLWYGGAYGGTVHMCCCFGGVALS